MLKPRILVTEKVQSQISFLCKQVHKVEWSGILFYRTEGKFGKDGFKCVLEDIFLMDIGDSGTTSYIFNEEVAAHMLVSPGLLDCKIAHIHSHHRMDVFFSDVDMGELHTNSPNYNFYLSLIVNNDNEMTAKIAAVGQLKTTESSVITYRDEHGEWATMELPAEEKFREILCIYNCDINKPGDLSQEFRDRFETIRSKNEVRSADDTVFDPKHLEQGTFFNMVDDLCKTHTGSVHVHGSHQPCNKVEAFIVKLLLHDIASEVNIGEALGLLNATWPEKPHLRDFGKFISGNAIPFYKALFPNDPDLMIFHATMEECSEVLSEWAGIYEFVPQLSKFFNIKSPKKRSPNGQFIK